MLKIETFRAGIWSQVCSELNLNMRDRGRTVSEERKLRIHILHVMCFGKIWVIAAHGSSYRNKAGCQVSFAHLNIMWFGSRQHSKEESPCLTAHRGSDGLTVGLGERRQFTSSTKRLKYENVLTTSAWRLSFYLGGGKWMFGKVWFLDSSQNKPSLIISFFLNNESKAGCI